jgi:hypothetical protein
MLHIGDFVKPKARYSGQSRRLSGEEEHPHLVVSLTARPAAETAAVPGQRGSLPDKLISLTHSGI